MMSNKTGAKLHAILPRKGNKAVVVRRADLKERLLHDFNDMKFEALTAPY